MKRIKKRRAFELCWNERRALAVVDSPFAVGLKYAFHDSESSRLVLVIDLPLSDGDFDTERWNYVSPDAYQAEVVWLLQWEEEKRGPRTRVEAVAEKASSACAVS